VGIAGQPPDRQAGHERDHLGRVALGVGHAERRQPRRGDLLVGRHAAPRRVAEPRIARRVEVKLQFGDLLGDVRRRPHRVLDHLGNPLSRHALARQPLRDALAPRGLLLDVQQKALAQQLVLTAEVVGERAERHARRPRHAPVGDRRHPTLRDQPHRRAQDALARARLPRAPLPRAPLARAGPGGACRRGIHDRGRGGLGRAGAHAATSASGR